MGPAWAAEDLSASFAADDTQRRLEFGHELAGYVRSLRAVGHHRHAGAAPASREAKTSQVEVYLRRSPLGRLAVTIQSGLEPVAGG